MHSVKLSLCTEQKPSGLSHLWVVICQLFVDTLFFKSEHSVLFDSFLTIFVSFQEEFQEFKNKISVSSVFSSPYYVICYGQFSI